MAAGSIMTRTELSVGAKCLLRDGGGYAPRDRAFFSAVVGFFPPAGLLDLLEQLHSYAEDEPRASLLQGISPRKPSVSHSLLFGLSCRLYLDLKLIRGVTNAIKTAESQKGTAY